jgi:hypothetical protein
VNMFRAMLRMVVSEGRLFIAWCASRLLFEGYGTLYLHIMTKRFILELEEYERTLITPSYRSNRPVS